MKLFLKYSKIVALITAVVLSGIFPEDIKAQEVTKTVDIMFTSDMHSHLNNFSTVTEEGTQNLGGFSRIRTLIEEQKEKNPDTLMVDGGDFSMGTLIQTIYTTEAPELRLMGCLGVEATTLGNHEFDYRSKGLADMLLRAKESKEPVPEMLVCNIDWEAMEDDMSKGQQQLSEALDAYGVKPYTMISKGDINIAVIGVFGKDALACAPTCELEFKDPVSSVRQTVEEIEEQEEADLIICLSHSGTNENKKKSEDEILAQEVPQLDIILSGHSHTELEEPIIYEDTYIVGCGEYGERLGFISMEQKPDGRWQLLDYELIPVDEEVPVHLATQEKVDRYFAVVDETYLKDMGYTAEQVLAYNPYEFSTVNDVYEEHTDHNLGNLISDAFYEAVSRADTKDDTPVVVAIVPSGCIRESYKAGALTVEDIFNSYSLGIGTDESAGYPLISVYLTGKELKTIAEIDASVSNWMKSARLYSRGLNFSYNPNRLPLNKVTDVCLTNENGEREEIEDEKLYRVVADLYSGQMLGAVENTSYGILSVTPKFSDGTPIEHMEDAVIFDGSHGNREIKAWTAIASYIETFPKNAKGIPEVPVQYEQAAGRKMVENTWNPAAILSGLNLMGGIILLAGVLLFGILAGIVIILKRHIKNIRHSGGK